MQQCILSPLPSTVPDRARRACSTFECKRARLHLDPDRASLTQHARMAAPSGLRVQLRLHAHCRWSGVATIAVICLHGCSYTPACGPALGCARTRARAHDSGPDIVHADAIVDGLAGQGGIALEECSPSCHATVRCGRASACTRKDTLRCHRKMAQKGRHRHHDGRKEAAKALADVVAALPHEREVQVGQRPAPWVA